MAPERGGLLVGMRFCAMIEAKWRRVPTRKPKMPRRPDDWVDELIAMTRPGMDMVLWDERIETLDHYRVNIPDEADRESLREAAEAHGRTVEEEIREIVKSSLGTNPIRRPKYPPGMEPLPGEGMGTWLHRISRPGLDFEIERDRTPHEGFEL